MRPFPVMPVPYNPSLLRLSGGALLTLAVDLIDAVEGNRELLPGESPAVLDARLAECERVIATDYGLH